jgi:ubiquitin-protein ligase
VDTLEENPFVWTVSVTGPSGTFYDHHSFEVEIVLNRDTGNVNLLPRVRFLTPERLFHPNVSPSGYPWLPVQPAAASQRDDDTFLTGCVESIVLVALRGLLSREPSCSPVAWVNPEAAKLYFSKDVDGHRRWLARAVAAVACGSPAGVHKELTLSKSPQAAF